MPRIDRLTAETRFFQVQAPAPNETRPNVITEFTCNCVDSFSFERRTFQFPLRRNCKNTQFFVYLRVASQQLGKKETGAQNKTIVLSIMKRDSIASRFSRAVVLRFFQFYLLNLIDSFSTSEYRANRWKLRLVLHLIVRRFNYRWGEESFAESVKIQRKKIPSKEKNSPSFVIWNRFLLKNRDLFRDYDLFIYLLDRKSDVRKEK